MANTFYLVIYVALAFTVNFFIIYLAVQWATRKIEDRMKYLVKLAVIDLKAKGIDTQTLKEASGATEEIARLQKSTSITPQEKTQRIRRIEQQFRP